MLSVKDFQVAGAGDCGMRRLLAHLGGGQAPALHFSWTTRCQLTVREELGTLRDCIGTIFVPMTKPAGLTGAGYFLNDPKIATRRVLVKAQLRPIALA